MSDLVIDIEEFSKENKVVPKGSKYRIRVDRTKYIVNSSTITGREILELAGKTPVNKWMLNQRLRGGGILKIGYDDVVDLTVPGIERFQTLPLDQTDGGELRKQFSLPEEDIEYLDSLRVNYEMIVERNNRWLLLHDFTVPNGFNLKSVRAALRIDNGYPVSQIDMIYFSPGLSRIDSKTIRNLSNTNIDGAVYQQWSRHRTPQNPWRPGVDDLSTHITQATFWLEKELLN